MFTIRQYIEIECYSYVQRYWKDEMMLTAMILRLMFSFQFSPKYAKEFLTNYNRPVCPCAICLDLFEVRVLLFVISCVKN